MQGFWLTLGWGLASLLAVSVLVALVEYLRQGAVPPRARESPLPRALNIDLDLNVEAGAIPAATQPPDTMTGREPESRAALADVLQRLQQASADAPWVETTPMVLAPRTPEVSVADGGLDMAHDTSNHTERG